MAVDPVPTPLPSDPRRPTPQELAESASDYYAAGFSFIPLYGDKKPAVVLLPNKRWHSYQERQPTPEEIGKWLRSGIVQGWGIVCGQVSGGIYGLDIDDALFSTWVEENLAEKILEQTWTVRTGSGKLHVYVRSQQIVRSGVLNHEGLKLADIRGDGSEGKGPSYLAAPPSRHPGGGYYTTLYGEPKFMLRVSDGDTLFRRIAGAYVQKRLVPVTASGTRILDPVSKDELDVLTYRIRNDAALIPKIKRAILRGARPGEGEWVQVTSDSEIQFAVVIALRQGDWSEEDIERVFASYPIGEEIYRNPTRSHHGSSILLHDIGKADLRLKRAALAAKQAKGLNFEILNVWRRNFSEPVYKVEIQFDTAERFNINVQYKELLTDRSFIQTVFKQTGIVPVLMGQHLGRGMTLFAARVSEMAIPDPVDEQATVPGRIRQAVRYILRRNIRAHLPEKYDEIGTGWRDDRYIWINPGPFITLLETHMRDRLNPEHLWPIIESMGGVARGVKFPGATADLWRIPTESMG